MRPEAIRSNKETRARGPRSTRGALVRLLVALAAVVAAATISAQLLKDVNPGSAGNNPSEFTVFNGSLYF
jgi:hypothetical protein